MGVKTKTSPTPLLSQSPPSRAVLPSADIETESPWQTFVPRAPLPTSLACWTYGAWALVTRAPSVTRFVSMKRIRCRDRMMACRTAFGSPLRRATVSQEYPLRFGWDARGLVLDPDNGS